MDNTALADPPPDAAAGWRARLDALVAEEGYFEPLGRHHHAFFIDAGPRLLVSFEAAARVRERPGGLPLAVDAARPHGWSALAIMAEGDSWWRDRAVYGYVDRLVDDAFFEDFEQVAFFGAGAGGYAACAFSVAAPGAHVLAIRPQATLDPALAGWDRRFRDRRRLCFTDRYGHAPDMIEGAGRVFVAYDPLVAEDAMHAALFRGRHVSHLRLPGAGPVPEAMLAEMGVLPQLLQLLGEGRLDAAAVFRAWRARRDHAPWLRRMLARAAPAGPARVAHLATAVLARHDLPKFRRALRAAQRGQSAEAAAD